MSRYASDRDGRFSERFESFVDIVIGFSLAELAISFATFPLHVSAAWISLVLSGYGWTFGMTVWLWLLYRRICEDFFVPTRAMIALHLVGLAGIMLLIFGVQFYLHYVSSAGATLADVTAAAIFYFVVLALTLALVAVQFFVGGRMRAGDLEPAIAAAGRSSAWRLATIAVTVAIGTAFVPRFGSGALLVLVPTMVLGGFAGRVLSATIAKRAA